MEARCPLLLSPHTDTPTHRHTHTHTERAANLYLSLRHTPSDGEMRENAIANASVMKEKMDE